MFARLRLQRLADSLSSRFAVAERAVLHRSPILLTPYRDDGSIDTAALERFVRRSYADAGVAPDSVDTGAVILTGAALASENAPAIADLFAREGGHFVCATAGHRFEALLAAHGSGAVALSRERRAPVLNVDLGGGTSKLALVDDGDVVATSAVEVGARVVAFGADGTVARLEPAGERLARELGIPIARGRPLARQARLALADRMADLVVAAAAGRATAYDLLGTLPAAPRPASVTFSGGVAEYVYGRERADHGDLARELADALLRRRDALPAPLAEPREGIRATVIGASQFSVQLSGNTSYLSDEALLPLRSVPVARAAATGGAEKIAGAIGEAMRRLDLAAEGPVAIALEWDGEPGYARLRKIAEGIARAAGARRPLVVALRTDVARSLGHILVDELGFSGGLVVLDGLELAELDFVDVGGPVRPADVVPVVVKSLVFREARPAR